MQTDK